MHQYYKQQSKMTHRSVSNDIPFSQQWHIVRSAMTHRSVSNDTPFSQHSYTKVITFFIFHCVEWRTNCMGIYFPLSCFKILAVDLMRPAGSAVYSNGTYNMTSPPPACNVWNCRVSSNYTGISRHLMIRDSSHYTNIRVRYGIEVSMRWSG
jgi:hypothetical protein